MTEEQIQAQCFKWLWNQHPETRGLLFHVPNGGKRNKREAARFKAIGVTAGIPDFVFLWKGTPHGIEMKTDKGKLQPSQVAIQRIWQREKIPYFVAHSLEEFQNIIEGIFAFYPES